ncbi:MAG: hypothetical protein KGH75_12850 [Rhodospirillales bacterium]|nr:hypothetical protein [Rhodospirillales bacterium]
MGLIDSLSSGLGDALSDPNNAGLLGLAQGLLASSGASRLPVTMGAAMTNGLGGAMSGYNSGMEMQQKKMQQKLMLQRLGLLGNSPFGDGGAGAAPMTPAPSVMSGAGPAGMPVTSGASAAPAPASGVAGGPGSMFGLDPANAFRYGQFLTQVGDPSGPEIMKGAIGFATPTNEIKNNAWMGKTPQMALQADVAAASKAGEIERRGGNEFYNFYTGASGLVPKIPDLANPVGGIAPNGALPGGVAPMAGALPLARAAAAATQGGKTAASVGTITNPDGSTTTGYNADLLGAPPAAASIPPALTAPRVPTPGAAPTPGASRTVTGPSATDTELRGTGLKQYTTAQGEASGIGVYRDLLNTARDLFADPANKFGPGSPEIARLKALASNLPGINMTGAQTAQDVLSKVSNQIATTQLGVGGTGSDRQLEALIHANPHGEMTNAAALKVIPMLQSQLDVKEARAKALQSALNSGGDAKVVPQRVSEFNGLADPATVTLGRNLAAASAAGTVDQFVKSLTPAQRALLPNAQKLDALGAF